jgi:regulator of sirC expression with transglutaminase-like and TPR domain
MLTNLRSRLSNERKMELALRDIEERAELEKGVAKDLTEEEKRGRESGMHCESCH